MIKDVHLQMRRTQKVYCNKISQNYPCAFKIKNPELGSKSKTWHFQNLFPSNLPQEGDILPFSLPPNDASSPPPSQKK